MFALKKGIKVLIIEKDKEDDDYKHIDISRNDDDDDDLNKSKTYNISKNDDDNNLNKSNISRNDLNEKCFSKTPNRDEKLQTEKKSINDSLNSSKSIIKPIPIRGQYLLSYLNSSSEDTITLDEEIKTIKEDIVDKKLTPILTKEGYYTIPSMNELAKFGKNQLKAVNDFVVGRKEHGEILFYGKTDLAQLDLDKIVQIEKRYVDVYNETDFPKGIKPEKNVSLNKKSRIKLFGIFPPKGKTNDQKKNEIFLKKLKKKNIDSNSEFIRYDTEKGIWNFIFIWFL